MAVDFNKHVCWFKLATFLCVNQQALQTNERFVPSQLSPNWTNFATNYSEHSPATGHVLGQLELGSHMVSESFDSLSGKFICFFSTFQQCHFLMFCFQFLVPEQSHQTRGTMQKKRKLRLRKNRVLTRTKVPADASFKVRTQCSFSPNVFQNTSLKI